MCLDVDWDILNACVQKLASDTERVMYAFISAKRYCEWTCSQTI